MAMPPLHTELRRELERLGLELMQEGSGPNEPIYVRIDGLPIGHVYDRGIGWMVYANNVKIGAPVDHPTFDSAIRAVLERARW